MDCRELPSSDVVHRSCTPPGDEPVPLLDASEARYEPCRVLPVADFLRRLWDGEILG